MKSIKDSIRTVFPIDTQGNVLENQEHPEFKGERIELRIPIMQLAGRETETVKAPEYLKLEEDQTYQLIFPEETLQEERNFIYRFAKKLSSEIELSEISHLYMITHQFEKGELNRAYTYFNK